MKENETVKIIGWGNYNLLQMNIIMGILIGKND